MPPIDPKSKATLIATLGTEPQVVTSAVDLLLKKSIVVSEVIIVHTSPESASIQNAINRLQDDFSRSVNANIIFRMMPLSDDEGHPLADVETPQAAHYAFKTLYQIIRSIKKEGQIVHLSIAGGRKTLALYGMAAAQLLFDEDDCLWYLFSSGDFLSSKRLHPTPEDEVSLVPIPVILWSQVSPLVSDLREIDDPFEAVKQVEALRLTEKRETARGFVYGVLTPAERKVVEVLVRDGLSDVEIAERLFLSPRTVEQHLRSAYVKAAAHWEMENVNRAQLVALLQYFYITKLRENPQDKTRPKH